LSPTPNNVKCACWPAAEQLIRDRIRLQAQLEALLEDFNIKLSSVIADLFGSRGRRILDALAGGASNPTQLAALGDRRLHCSTMRLADALQARPTAHRRELLRLLLADSPYLTRTLKPRPV
jgi:transposase